MIVILDLGTFKDFEAHVCEYIDHFIADDGDGMHGPLLPPAGRQRDIHLFPSVSLLQLQLIDLFTALLITLFRKGFKLVDQLADSRSFFLGDGAETLHQFGNAAFFSEKILPECGKLFTAVHQVQPLLHLFPQGFDLLIHLTHLQK